MDVGTRVKLISFNGYTSDPEDDSDPAENYWLLVGSVGKIVNNFPPSGVSRTRVLVQFEEDVQALGLHCHNEVQNSLWIMQKDLAAVLPEISGSTGKSGDAL